MHNHGTASMQKSGSASAAMEFESPGRLAGSGERASAGPESFWALLPPLLPPSGFGRGARDRPTLWRSRSKKGSVIGPVSPFPALSGRAPSDAALVGVQGAEPSESIAIHTTKYRRSYRPTHQRLSVELEGPRLFAQKRSEDCRAI